MKWIISLLFVVAVGIIFFAKQTTAQIDVSTINNKRIYVMGDLHGDLDRAVEIIRELGLIDGKSKWIGGNSVLVQLGDQIDRGRKDKEIIIFFDELKVQAQGQGGDVISLLGNHEILNSMLIFHSVNSSANTDFAQYYTSLNAMGERCRKFFDKNTVPQYQQRYFQMQSMDGNPVPYAVRGRAMAFCPGGTIANILSKRNVFEKVGRNLFVHGSLMFKYAALGLDGLNNMNEQVKNWLAGGSFDLKGMFDSFENFADDNENPFNSRFFAEKPEKEICKVLERVLKKLDADRLVIGHTIQKEGIQSGCNGRLWKVDTGMSRGFVWPVAGKQESLVIEGGSVRITKINEEKNDSLNRKMVDASTVEYDPKSPYSNKCCKKVAAEIIDSYLTTSGNTEVKYKIRQLFDKNFNISRYQYRIDECSFETATRYVVVGDYSPAEDCI